MDQSGKKEDRRVTRTRTAIRRAFRELVKEKGYEAVTIEEITERANLGRTTFYLHYHDKEDLFLEDFERKLFSQVEIIAPRPLLRWFTKGEDSNVRAMFDLVLENADLFQIIAKEQTSKIYDRFRDIHTKAIDRLIQDNPNIQKRASKIDYPLELVLNYYLGALWSCIIWWARQDFKPGAAEMSDFFLRMFNPGLFMVVSGIKTPDILLNLIKTLPESSPGKDAQQSGKPASQTPVT